MELLCEKSFKPVTIVQDCVPTFVSVTPLDRRIMDLWILCQSKRILGVKTRSLYSPKFFSVHKPSWTIALLGPSFASGPLS